MRDRLEWHRDHAAVAMADLPNVMEDWVDEMKTESNTRARTGRGVMLDDGT